MTALEARIWVMEQTIATLRKHSANPELIRKNLGYKGSNPHLRKIANQMGRLADRLQKMKTRTMLAKAGEDLARERKNDAHPASDPGAG